MSSLKRNSQALSPSQEVLSLFRKSIDLEPTDPGRNGHSYNGMTIGGSSRAHVGDHFGHVYNVNPIARARSSSPLDKMTRQKKGSELLIAAAHGETKRVEQLLDAGAGFDHCISSNPYDSTTAKVKENLPISDHRISAEDLLSPGTSALMLASFRGHQGCVDLLLNKGARINKKNANRQNALYYAVLGGNTNIAKRLVTDGAERIPAKFEESVLHAAAVRGQEDLVSFFVETRELINRVDEHCRTPLHIAVQYGNIRATEILLQNGADVARVDDAGYTPLLRCVSYKNLADEPKQVVKIMKMLLGKNADVKAKLPSQETALHIAARNNFLEGVELLIDKCALVNAKDHNDLTPLHEAISAFIGQSDTETNEKRRKAIIKLLLSRGAKVNAKSRENVTALHIAARLGLLGIIRTLYNHDAYLDAVDNDQKTPLAMAKDQEVRKLLLELGADPVKGGLKPPSRWAWIAGIKNILTR